MLLEPVYFTFDWNSLTILLHKNCTWLGIYLDLTQCEPKTGLLFLSKSNTLNSITSLALSRTHILLQRNSKSSACAMLCVGPTHLLYFYVSKNQHSVRERESALSPGLSLAKSPSLHSQMNNWLCTFCRFRLQVYFSGGVEKHRILNGTDVKQKLCMASVCPFVGRSFGLEFSMNINYTEMFWVELLFFFFGKWQICCGLCKRGWGTIEVVWFCCHIIPFSFLIEWVCFAENKNNDFMMTRCLFIRRLTMKREIIAVEYSFAVLYKTAFYADDQSNSFE